MITFRILSPHATFKILISFSIKSYFLSFNHPILITISISEAPFARAGADYIKTSTGFGGAGATFGDIELFAKHIGPNVKMKAAGGISSIDDAEKFLELGADRLGTSRIVKIVKNEEATGY